MFDGKTTSAKPFLKWAGGKGKLLNEIEEHLPANFSKMSGATYVEPFVGGGAVLFWLLQRYTNITRVVINDTNPDLICAYKVVRDNPSELIAVLQRFQDEYTALEEDRQQEYFLAKRDLFNTRSGTATERAAMFIFLNKTCFNGLYRVNSSGRFNVPFGKYSNPTICDRTTILADSKLLQGVEIYCNDFSTMLDVAGPNTLFYLDPPYRPLSKTSGFCFYTKEGFNEADQLRLYEFCLEIDRRESNFIMSNSDTTNNSSSDMFFDKLYRQFEIDRVFAGRSINSVAEKRGKLRELMITNNNKNVWQESLRIG